MSIALIIVSTGIVLLFTWWFIELFKCNRALAKYPGPRSVPLIGHAHYIGSLTDVVPVFSRLQKEYGGTFKILLAHRPRLIICDYKILEFLLASTTILEKSYEYKYTHSWLGTGLLTSSSAKWKRQRKLITPTFHFQILEQFIETFNNQSDILVKKLRNDVGKKSIDIFPYINLCALDVICEAAMGTSVNAQNSSDSEYVRSVKEMCRIIVDRSISPFKMFDFPYIFSKVYRKEKKALRVLHGYTNHVISKRREELLNHHESPTTDNETGIKKRSAFLDLLLQCNVDGQPLSDEMIREEVDTFMFEGHDTITSGISFALYLLSKHSEVQERVVEELRKIFADDKERPATYQDLQDLKYLEMVIKESLRLFPPVPVYGRCLEEDVEYDGSILPKGLSLTVYAYGLHRQPEVFSDPEKFNPERFSPENSAGRSPYSYVPFSAGPRNCIGQRFAVLEMKSVIAKVLINFQLLPVVQHEPVLSCEVIIKSTTGLYIGLKGRNF